MGFKRAKGSMTCCLAQCSRNVGGTRPSRNLEATHPKWLHVLTDFAYLWSNDTCFLECMNYSFHQPVCYLLATKIMNFEYILQVYMEDYIFKNTDSRITQNVSRGQIKKKPSLAIVIFWDFCWGSLPGTSAVRARPGKPFSGVPREWRLTQQIDLCTLPQKE